MRCHVIHGDNADLLTGFISVEASVGSCGLTNIEIYLIYMWIWSSLCLWMPWPHQVLCHSLWQCWSPDWIYLYRGLSLLMCSWLCQWPQYAQSSGNGLSMLMCFNKDWNVSSIHVNLILTVLMDALAPWGAMSSTVTKLISKLDSFLSGQQYYCSSALVNIEISLLYMWIWSSLCSWMPWPHEVPCHPRWQCWFPNWI